VLSSGNQKDVDVAGGKELVLAGFFSAALAVCCAAS